MLRLATANEPHVRRVLLEGCENVTETALVLMVDACADLVEVDLAGMTEVVSDRVVRKLAFQSEKLRDLRVARCGRVTDDALRELGAHCAELRALDITGCAQITSAGLEALFAGCRHMTLAGLRGCAPALLSPAALREALINQPPNAMRSDRYTIDLSKCTWVPDALVASVLRHEKLQAARAVVLSGCVQVGDATATAIAEHLRRIELLDLTRCFRVTDAAMQRIAKVRVVLA